MKSLNFEEQGKESFPRLDKELESWVLSDCLKPKACLVHPKLSPEGSYRGVFQVSVPVFCWWEVGKKDPLLWIENGNVFWSTQLPLELRAAIRFSRKFPNLAVAIYKRKQEVGLVFPIFPLKKVLYPEILSLHYPDTSRPASSLLLKGCLNSKGIWFALWEDAKKHIPYGWTEVYSPGEAIRRPTNPGEAIFYQEDFIKPGETLLVQAEESLRLKIKKNIQL